MGITQESGTKKLLLQKLTTLLLFGTKIEHPKCMFTEHEGILILLWQATIFQLPDTSF